jgi:hypothetical protein
MQFIRDRLPDRGILTDGSSYVNLYDGGADRASWTLSDRNRQPFLTSLGGRRILLLLLLHPVRALRMLAVSILEYFREEKDRLISQLRGQSTYYWWYLPFLHIGTNVVLRELQTLSVLLDIYVGVPKIYTTYNAYDEFAHHFGPSSRTAYKSLRALDRRIKEIFKLTNRIPGRPYDIYILSDHGQTPSVPYRIRYGETSATPSTERRGAGRLHHGPDRRVRPARRGRRVPHGRARGGRQHLQRAHPEGRASGSAVAPPSTTRLPPRRRSGPPPRGARPGGHLLLLPRPRLLDRPAPRRPFDEIRDDPERRALYYFLVAHRGIGVVLTRMLDGVHAEATAAAPS